MSKLNKIALLFAVIVLACGVQFASAVSVNIPNAGGELPPIPAGSDWAAPAAIWSGWMAANLVMDDSGETYGYSRFPLGIPEGNQVLTSQTTAPGNNATYQLPLPASEVWQANTVYTLSAYEGFDASGTANFQDNVGGKIEVFGAADGWATPLAVLSFGAAPVGGFQFGSVTFDTASFPTQAGQAMMVRIQNYDSPSGWMGSSCSWDAISLTYEVPEPGTLALLAAGLLGLIAYAWRKR